MKYLPLPLPCSIFTLLAVLAGGSPVRGQTDGKKDEFAPMPPVMAKSVQEEAKSFQLPPGYRLEPVLTEPEIKEPGVIAFDGDGRMFVAELRTY